MGESLHTRTLSGNWWELAIFTNLGVQTYNIHTVDLLPLLDSVICFGSFGSTPVQAIPNIYWRVLHIEMWAMFSYWHPQIETTSTSVLDFLQPRFSFLIHILQSFLSLTNGFMSIGHAKTHMPKPSELLKDFIRLCTVRINFHIR